jgi:hypothetical protein
MRFRYELPFSLRPVPKPFAQFKLHHSSKQFSVILKLNMSYHNQMRSAYPVYLNLLYLITLDEESNCKNYSLCSFTLLVSLSMSQVQIFH